MVATHGEVSGPELLIANPACDPTEAACLMVHAPDICKQLQITLSECKSLSAWNAKGDKLAPKPYEGAIDINVRVRLANKDVVERTLRSYTTFGPCGDPSLFAYRGESKSGHPLIETTEGMAELIEPPLAIGLEGARLLISASSREVVGKLTAPHDATGKFAFDFRDADNILLFTREYCVSAPGSGRGRINSAMDTCKLSELLRESAAGSQSLHDVGLTSATLNDVALAGSFAPWAPEYFGDDFAKRVGRISGSDIIVVDLLEACT